jgi:phosphoserine phosphatase
LSIHQCLAVGDGANDLPMLNAAGLGVAFHGKPLVRQQAPHQLNQVDLGALLHLV